MLEWLKKWGALILSAVLALVTLGYLRRRKQLGKLKDLMAVTQARKEMDELRAVRERLEQDDQDRRAAIAQVDKQLAENKQAIRDAFEGGDNATDEELDARLLRLGL